jgi:hypothetical protein
MAVLKGVPALLTPDLLFMLSSMGHGEQESRFFCLSLPAGDEPFTRPQVTNWSLLTPTSLPSPLLTPALAPVVWSAWTALTCPLC